MNRTHDEDVITRSDVWLCFRYAMIWVAVAMAACFAFITTGLADGPSYQPRSRIGVPEPAAVQPFNWTGLYASGGLGYGLAHTPVDIIFEGRSLANVDGFSADGFVGDIRAGFDWQFPNSPFLVGAFAGYNFGEMKFNARVGGANLSATLEPDYYAGLRFGLVVAQKTLVYVGAAYQPAEGSLGGVASGSQTDETIIYMLGLEQAILPNVKLGVEYNYGEYSFQARSGGTVINIDPEVHTIKARLAFSLNLFN